MSLLDVYPRLQAVAHYAETHIHASAAQSGNPTAHIGPNYRWEHTLRVTQYGVQIAAGEDARLELVAAACLLHDSEWYSDYQADSTEHGRYAAREIRSFLEQAGYSAEEVDNICYSVAVHVDGNAGYEHEHTMEARVVSDADNVDRFGALRTVFWCIDEVDDLPALAVKLEKRVQKLKDFRARQVMETATGNQLFNQQLDHQIKFFNRLIAEHNLTRMPD
jgi:HD domain